MLGNKLGAGNTGILINVMRKFNRSTSIKLKETEYFYSWSRYVAMQLAMI